MSYAHWLLLFFIPFTICQPPKFYSGYGVFVNNCAKSDCSRCGVGEYKAGCKDANQGVCAPCTNLPANAAWITDGGFADSCQFNCQSSFSPVGSTCILNTDKVYVVTVGISLPLSKVEIEANKDKIVASFATLSQCGICGSSSANPILCQYCRMTISILQTSSRRLLASSTILASIEQLKGASQAETSKTRLSSSVNIDQQLSINSIPVLSAVTTQPATQTLPVPPPSGSPSPTSSSSSGSNVGVIVGAVAGVVVLIVAVSVTLCCFITRKTPSKEHADHVDHDPAAGTQSNALTSQLKSDMHRQRTMRMMRLETLADMTMPMHATLVMAATNRAPHYPLHGVHRPPFQNNPH